MSVAQWPSIHKDPRGEWVCWFAEITLHCLIVKTIVMGALINVSVYSRNQLIETDVIQ